MATEVLVPLYRITEWRDGAVFQTESAGEAWIPVEQMKTGAQFGEDQNLRIGTPDKFTTRKVNNG